MYINYEMLWIRLKEHLKDVECEDGMIHISDLQRLMDDLFLDERE